jgi:hypothetical protein
MSFVYTPAKYALMTGALAFNSSDMRVLLVMTNTTADTQEDVATFAAITTLDEFNGSGYVAGGGSLAAETVTEDDTLNLAKFLASNFTFATLGAGTRQIQAAVVYKFNGSIAASQPVAFIDTGGFPISANGGDITLQWNANGIIQAA